MIIGFIALVRWSKLVNKLMDCEFREINDACVVNLYCQCKLLMVMVLCALRCWAVRKKWRDRGEMRGELLDCLVMIELKIEMNTVKAGSKLVLNGKEMDR